MWATRHLPLFYPYYLLIFDKYLNKHLYKYRFLKLEYSKQTLFPIALPFSPTSFLY